MIPLLLVVWFVWCWFWRRHDRRVDRDLQYDCDRPGGRAGI